MYVLLNNSNATPLAWGSTPFFIQNGNRLLFNSPSADKPVVFQNDIDLNGSLRTIDVAVGQQATAIATLSGAISGNGASGLVKTGAGKLFVSGNNSYVGVTQINAGTLALSASERLADSSSLELNAGIFDLGGFAETISTVTVNGGTVTSGILKAEHFIVKSGTIGADLIGSGSLEKLGAGLTTLTGANSYSGETVVRSGALVLTHSVLSDSAAVRLVDDVIAGTVLRLDFTGTDIVGSLTIDGVVLPAGIYGANHPNYGNFFDGPGTLTVVPAGSLSPAALTPAFESTTATATGFTVQISNYDA